MIGIARRSAATVLAALAVLSLAGIAPGWDLIAWFPVRHGGCDRSLVVSAWEPGFCPSQPDSARLA